MPAKTDRFNFNELNEKPLLPAVSEYAAALDKMQDAYDEVEQISWMLAAVVEYPTDDPMPVTLADIGALFSFADDVRVQIAQTSDVHARIVDHLGEIVVMCREYDRLIKEASGDA